MPLPPFGVIVYLRAIAVANGAGVVGTALLRFTVMSVGAVVVPELILIVLKGFPKLSAAPFITNPIRLTFPTTSVVPAELPAAGCINVNEPVSRSPLVRVSSAFTVAFTASVTPLALLIVGLLNVVAKEPPTV